MNTMEALIAEAERLEAKARDIRAFVQNTLLSDAVAQSPQQQEVGLSDAVRIAMRKIGRPCSAAEIRRTIVEIGIRVRSTSINPLANVSATLKSFSDSGQVRKLGVGQWELVL